MYTHLALSSWCSFLSPLLSHYRLTVNRSCYTKLSAWSFSRFLTFVLQKGFSQSVVIQLLLNERNSVCEMSSFLTKEKFYAPFCIITCGHTAKDSSSYWGLIPPFLQKLFLQNNATMYSVKILHCRSSTKCFICMKNSKSLILHTFR